MRKLATNKTFIFQCHFHAICLMHRNYGKWPPLCVCVYESMDFSLFIYSFKIYFVNNFFYSHFLYILLLMSVSCQLFCSVFFVAIKSHDVWMLWWWEIYRNMRDDGIVSFGGNGNNIVVGTRNEPISMISLSTLDRDCFIIPVHSLGRFLPAGIPVSKFKIDNYTFTRMPRCTHIHTVRITLVIVANNVFPIFIEFNIFWYKLIWEICTWLNEATFLVYYRICPFNRSKCIN